MKGGQPQCSPCLPWPDSRLFEMYQVYLCTLSTASQSQIQAMTARRRAVRWQPLPCSSLPTICLAPKMCLAKTASHRPGAPRMRRPEGSLADHSALPLAPPCSLALMCGHVRVFTQQHQGLCSSGCCGVKRRLLRRYMLSSSASLSRSRTGCHIRSLGRSATGRPQLWRMHAHRKWLMAIQLEAVEPDNAQTEGWHRSNRS